MSISESGAADAATATHAAHAAHAARAAWLRVLALAGPQALGDAYGRLRQQAELPGYRFLRKPESGMTMVRARAGGTGEQFNLGETSVTRCAVVLAADAEAGADTVGVAYVQGRHPLAAEQIAVLDALLQLPAWHDRVLDIVVTPLERAHAERAARQTAVAAQTRVEFFTMVRGD